MDGVSLVASVLTLVQAVHVGGKGLAKLKSCYYAPPEIDMLRAEVKSLAQLLENVDTFAHGSSPRHSGDILIGPIGVATARIGSVNKLLVSPAFGISRLSDENKARLTSLRYRKRLINLEREIKESIQEIGVRLTFVTA